MGLNDSYEHGIVRGIVRYAREKTHWKLYGAGWMFRGLGNIRAWHGDGIIARAESAEQARLLAATGLPTVDVAGAYLVPGLHPVTGNDYQTGKTAGRHLSAAGFSNFAFCGVGNVGWSLERLRGYMDGVSAPVSVFEQSLPWWEQPEEFGSLPAWIEALHQPAGLFACNDTAGIKVTALCKRLGIVVPRDIAVLGVDNEEILCELSDPPLSSIPLDCEQIGYRAAAELARLIENHDTAEKNKTPFPVVPALPIVERASTQTIQSSDPVVARAAEYIREHADRKLLVSRIAAAASVSRRTLELRFRAATGRSVHQEIVRARMQRAATILRETNLPIRAVAVQCGMTTPQRFYAQFRAAEGCTPSEYRMKYH